MTQVRSCVHYNSCVALTDTSLMHQWILQYCCTALKCLSCTQMTLLSIRAVPADRGQNILQQSTVLMYPTQHRASWACTQCPTWTGRPVVGTVCVMPMTAGATTMSLCLHLVTLWCPRCAIEVQETHSGVTSAASSTLRPRPTPGSSPSGPGAPRTVAANSWHTTASSTPHSRQEHRQAQHRLYRGSHGVTGMNEVGRGTSGTPQPCEECHRRP